MIHNGSPQTAAAHSSRTRGLVYLLIAAPAALSMFGFALAVQDEQPPEPAGPAGQAGQAEPAGRVGLQGILPGEIPRDLDFEAFSVLGGNWEAWAEETTEEVARLYTEINQLDLEAQRELLESLRRRSRQMDLAIADARYRSIYDRLITLEGNLLRQLDLLEAALETLELDPREAGRERMESARPDVLSAISNARSSLNSYRNGGAWVRYFRLEGLEAALRDGADAPPEARRIALEVHERLDNLDRLNPEQRQFLQKPAIDRLRSAVAEYARAQRTAEEPAETQRLREALAQLFDAVSRYEEAASDGSSSDLREAYGAVRSAAPDGGARVIDALRDHYFNYNLKVVASEPFLWRLVHEQRSEAGAVSDYIMGASVSGMQYTWANSGIDLKRNLEDAKFDLTIQGNVNSNTVGATSQATVHTIGNHSFWGAKEVRFNGYEFTTGPSRISADANNRTAGINVRHGWIPIIGWIARGIARREVARRTPQAEAIAESKIVDRVRPEMDREVDQQLVNAERDIQTDLYSRLDKSGLYPQATRVKTSDDYLWMNYRVWGRGEMAGDRLSYTRNQGGGVTVHVHESYLNNMADRWGFAGRTMTETEVRRELEDYFSTLMGRKVDFSADEPPDPEEGPDTFVFAERDPVRVQVEAGQINLIIRAAFKQEGREDIPQQVVTVPLMYRIDGDDIVVDRGSVIVAPAEEPPSAAEQIARAGVIRKKIEASIPERRRSRTIVFTRQNDEDFPVRINRVLPLNGWVTVWGQ